MGAPEQRKSTLRVFVESRINYHTVHLGKLRIPPATREDMANIVFVLIAATSLRDLLRLAEEVDSSPRPTRRQPYAETLQDKYADLVKEQIDKKEGEELSIKMIVNSLKPDLAQELGKVRLSDSPHQDYLATACRSIMREINTTAFAGKNVDTTTNTNGYL